MFYSVISFFGIPSIKLFAINYIKFKNFKFFRCIAGKYSAQRIRASGAQDIVIGEVMHPSPANPKANKEWAKVFEIQLKSLGVIV